MIFSYGTLKVAAAPTYTSMSYSVLLKPGSSLVKLEQTEKVA
jgi:hypothetical protein